MVRIAEVLSGTIAEALDLEIGSRIVRINGEPVRDTIDFRFLEVDESLEVEVASSCGGRVAVYEIEKGAGEALGIVAQPDAIRECANKCVFCFIDGNPSGARETLYLRDDDFRLSFSHGNYVTLTNLGPRGFERLIEQRLSPLYVSVHATEPEVRMRLLGVPRGGEIVEQLEELTSAGLEVHTQVVLCPEWNDGAHLERTIADLWELGPGVLSLSVVPVGLTRYNVNRQVRLLTAAEASAALEQVGRAQARARAERGHGWAYAADELFFIAGQDVPPASHYDDGSLSENGVGSVRHFMDAFERGVTALPRLDGKRIAVATGTRMASRIRELLPRASEATGATLDLVAVENQFFGPTVNTAGLLAGEDVRSALRDRGRFDVVLLPAEALNDDERFIDDLPLRELVAGLGGATVVPGLELTAALRGL